MTGAIGALRRCRPRGVSVAALRWFRPCGGPACAMRWFRPMRAPCGGVGPRGGPACALRRFRLPRRPIVRPAGTCGDLAGVMAVSRIRYGCRPLRCGATGVRPYVAPLSNGVAVSVLGSPAPYAYGARVCPLHRF